MNIDNILSYIKQCPYLKNKNVNVDYLVSKVIAYSITEQASYDPIVSKDIVGNKQCQFLFHFDTKLYWNEEVQNNIDNSNFCKNFISWLEENNNRKIFPLTSEGIEINSISTTTNGFIFDTNEDEAIYRISCKIEYFKYK